MPIITRRFPHLIQPQYPVKVKSPFSWAVNFSGGPGSTELVTGILGTPTGGPTSVVTSNGVGIKLVDLQHWEGPAGRIPTAFPITLVTSFTADALAISQRIFQSGFTSNYAGFWIWVTAAGGVNIGYGDNTAVDTGSGNRFITLPDGTVVVGKNYNIAARLTSDGSIVVAVNGRLVAGTYLGSSTTIVTVGKPNVGRLQYSGGNYYSTSTVNLVAAGQYAAADPELIGLTLNPWQLFEPLKRNIYVEAAASGVSGTIAATMAAFTSSIAGTTTVVGTIAQTLANATSDFTGSTTVTGTIAKTLENDAGNLQGSTGSTSGTIAVTAQSDTASMSGKTTIVGTMNASTENATSNATGSTTILGQMAASVSNFIAAMTDAVGGIVARLLSLLGVGS